MKKLGFLALLGIAGFGIFYLYQAGKLDWIIEFYSWLLEFYGNLFSG